jgi:hypothetical protein
MPSKEKRRQASGACNRWWRKQFDKALRRGVALGCFSPGFARYVDLHGFSFASVIDYVDAVGGGVRRPEPGERGPIVDASHGGTSRD